MVVLKQNGSKLLTVKEAAQILHVHENTLRRWADQGILSAFRIGPRGDRRLQEDDVNEIKSHLSNK
jgi:excisionase family DNA binding protein